MTKNEFLLIISLLSQQIRQIDGLLKKKNAEDIFTGSMLTEMLVEQEKLKQKRAELKNLFQIEKAKNILLQVKNSFTELPSIERELRNTEVYSLKNYKYIASSKKKKNK